MLSNNKAPIATVKWKQKQLEIWGRAQHEAAWRPTSDLKYILGGCKLCKNLRDQDPLRAEI